MEVWNRDELYSEVWEQPLVKLAAKYGISAVMIGKVCRKLQIPLPGRGYWVKKEFGKPVERLPLPPVKNLPIVQRLKQMTEEPSDTASKPDPTDSEWFQIVEMESRHIRIDAEVKQHKLVKNAAGNLEHSDADERGILRQRYDKRGLDVRVSKGASKRALSILNAIIQTLETAGFEVSLMSDKRRTGVQVFGHFVSFALVEKLREKSRREIKETPTWTRRVIEYEPTGRLEFRVGEYYSSKSLSDGKTQRLEDLIPKCVGLLMREGRALHMWSEQAKRNEIERQKKQQEMAELAKQIEEEEKKVSTLEGWVSSWTRAEHMRQFITALEKVWMQEGHDLSPATQKGQRIVWMKQQADRLDPMIAGPASILDRKDELRRWL